MVISAFSTPQTDQNETNANSALERYELTRADEWNRLEFTFQLLRLECMRTVALINKLKST